MTDVIILALAAWRIASLLVNEDGPGAVFARLRYAAGIRYVVRQGVDGPEPTRTASNWLAEGLTCTWCVSIWCVCGLTLLRLALMAFGIVSVYNAIALIFAASAGAVLIGETVNRLRGE